MWDGDGEGWDEMRWVGLQMRFADALGRIVRAHKRAVKQSNSRHKKKCDCA